jgi:arylformamidase
VSSSDDRRFTRRDAGRAGLAATSLAVANSLPAQESSVNSEDSTGKGPAVWLDMDQAELDAVYNQARWAPNMQAVLQRCASNSNYVRAYVGEPRRFSYGKTSAEALDVYAADRRSAPVHVFIHGGAWSSGRAADFGFLAEPFVRAGAHFVAPDFTTVGDTGGKLAPLVDQVRLAIEWVYRNAGLFGGDRDRIFVSGHSSGAHLAGVALTTDWAATSDLPPDVIKGGLCCSGMFDLEPVGLSSRRDYVDFDDEVVERLSPQRQIGRLQAPLIVACGTLESPEFQRQARDFAAAAAGKRVEVLFADRYNHFEILETLASPYGLLGRAALTQMQLA